MSRLLRKQIYIDCRQERLLERRASELRVSESELGDCKDEPNPRRIERGFSP
jgi:hypothetical protein